MARDRNREAWEHDLEARQRNIVFPDTVANEARFWRNLTSGKQRITGATAVYISIYLLTAVGLVLGLMSGQLFELRRVGLPWWWRVITVGGLWAVVSTLMGGLLLLIRWRVSKVMTRPRGK
jgi:hypothetical protein